jgi:DNA helicase TIP49 (TBP-interacting protein)
VELSDEIQEFIDKYGQEKCLKYNLPLLLVQKIASKELRAASREWDVK